MQKRLTTRALLRAVAAPRTFALVAAFVAGGTAARAATPDFGSPPSGAIPILYNDHTVYADPDLLHNGRVLAALLRNGQLYVPLRSMFEQMGATVSASADGKTITATKSGATVTVVVGQKSALFNGEVRPLDVPPMLVHGVVLVPVRVLSEALGAYVLWVPERRIVVVRYVPAASPPPSLPPFMAPAPIATPATTPLITPEPRRTDLAFIAGAYSGVKNYTEISAGQYCPQYLLSGAYAYHRGLALKVDFRQYSYRSGDDLTDGIDNHYTHFKTIDGGFAYTPVFLARQSSLDARLEYQIAPNHINIGVGYLRTANNFGYPQLSGVGAGIEKLPDLRPGLGVFASGFYYPGASGDYTVADPSSPNAGIVFHQKYQVLKFDVGLTLVARHIPVYAYGGFAGEGYSAKQDAPLGQTHDGPYLGLGLKL